MVALRERGFDELKVKSEKRAHVEMGCDVGAGVSSADVETPRCRRRVSFVSFLCSFSLVSLLLSAFILRFFAGESTHPARTKTERSFWKAGELLYTRTDDSERTERNGWKKERGSGPALLHRARESTAPRSPPRPGRSSCEYALNKHKRTRAATRPERRRQTRNPLDPRRSSSGCDSRSPSRSTGTRNGCPCSVRTRRPTRCSEIGRSSPGGTARYSHTTDTRLVSCRTHSTFLCSVEPSLPCSVEVSLPCLMKISLLCYVEASCPCSRTFSLLCSITPLLCTSSTSSHLWRSQPRSSRGRPRRTSRTCARDSTTVGISPCSPRLGRSRTRPL